MWAFNLWLFSLFGECCCLLESNAVIVVFNTRLTLGFQCLYNLVMVALLVIIFKNHFPKLLVQIICFRCAQSVLNGLEWILLATSLCSMATSLRYPLYYQFAFSFIYGFWYCWCMKLLAFVYVSQLFICWMSKIDFISNWRTCFNGFPLGFKGCFLSFSFAFSVTTLIVNLLLKQPYV